MERKRPSKLLLFPTIIVAILLVGIGFAIHVQLENWNAIKENAVQTDAVITQIKTRRTGHGKKRHTTHTVYVEYEVDGQTYSTNLGYYSAGMHEGDTRPIYYDPSDPSKAMSDPTKACIIMGVIGGLLLIFIIFMLGSELKKCSAVNRLIAQGQYITCDDWEEQPAPITINGVRYHNVKCNVSDDRGNTYTLLSESFHPAKSPYKLGDTLKIYVDFFEDPTNYYVSKEPINKF